MTSRVVFQGELHTWVCGLETFYDMFSELNVDLRTTEMLVAKYRSVALVSALLLGITVGKFQELDEQKYAKLDVHLHGIVWCTSVYAFFCSTVLAVLFLDGRLWGHFLGKLFSNRQGFRRIFKYSSTTKYDEI